MTPIREWLRSLFGDSCNRGFFQESGLLYSRRGQVFEDDCRYAVSARGLFSIKRQQKFWEPLCLQIRFLVFYEQQGLEGEGGCKVTSAANILANVNHRTACGRHLGSIAHTQIMYWVKFLQQGRSGGRVHTQHSYSLFEIKKAFIHFQQGISFRSLVSWTQML